MTWKLAAIKVHLSFVPSTHKKRPRTRTFIQVNNINTSNRVSPSGNFAPGPNPLCALSLFLGAAELMSGWAEMRTRCVWPHSQCPFLQVAVSPQHWRVRVQCINEPWFSCGKVGLILTWFSRVLSRPYYLQAELTITTQHGRRGNVVSPFLLTEGWDGVWWYIGAWGQDAEEGISAGAMEQT